MAKSRKFKKPVSSDVLEKRFLRFFEIDKDRDFFVSCLKEKEGLFYPRDDLDKKSVERFDRLVKEVKANRGIVNMVPLVVFFILIAGLAVFYLFFMDSFAESLTERALSAAFSAEADVDGMDVALFLGKIEIRHVAVADSSEPAKNLFELYGVIVDVDIGAALVGRLVIDNLGWKELYFSTDRKSLAEYEDASGVESAPVEAPAEQGTAGGQLVSLDADSLLEEYRDRLESPAVAEELRIAKDALSELAERQKTELAKKTDELKAEAAELFSKNPADIRIQDIPAELEKLSSVTKKTEALYKDYELAYSKAKASADNVIKLSTELTQAIENDKKFLESALDIQGGGAKEFFEPAVRQLLSDKAEEYLYYGKKFLDLLGSIKKKPGKAKEEKVTPAGRVVDFPSEKIPSFFIRRAAGAAELDEGRLELMINSITSEPELVSEPARLLARFAGDYTAQAQAEFDMADDSYTAIAEIKGMPADSPALDSKLDARVQIEGTADILTLNARVLLKDIKAPGNPTLKAIADALKKSNKDAELLLSYTRTQDSDKLKLDSELWQLFADPAFLSDIAGTSGVRKQAEDALAKQVEDIAGQDAANQARSILSDFTAQKKELDDISSQLEERKKALNDRLKKTTDSAAKELQKKTQDAGSSLKNAADNLFGR